MQGFRRSVYMTRRIEVSPDIPSITIGDITSNSCYGEITINVVTSIPVKINILGTFQTGGSYADNSFLTGINQKYADVINEVISSDLSYNFGINAADSGVLTNISSIYFSVNDFDTDAEITSYTFSRNHAATPC